LGNGWLTRAPAKTAINFTINIKEDRERISSLMFFFFPEREIQCSKKEKRQMNNERKKAIRRLRMF
jgi:predicted RNA binding protein with dsRBD fold (UPF0201 family)